MWEETKSCGMRGLLWGVSSGAGGPPSHRESAAVQGGWATSNPITWCTLGLPMLCPPSHAENLAVQWRGLAQGQLSQISTLVSLCVNFVAYLQFGEG